MSDTQDPCDELLTPTRSVPDSAFRAALRWRTSRYVRLRVWLMRLAVFAVVAVIYLAGLLTPRPFIPVRPQETVAPRVAEAPIQPPAPSEPTESAIALEYRALESDRDRPELYRRAGDQYLIEDDLASAARCYRLALDGGADPVAHPDDTWLLLAIKNARLKEKANATVPH